MARLANTKEDYRLLFARTGNQCAFPGGCNHPLIDDDMFAAQVCHIEAAQPGGPMIQVPRGFPRTRGDRPNADLQVLSLEHLPSTGGERIETNPGGPLRASSAERPATDV